MLPMGFEPKISAGERPLTYVLDRTAGTGELRIAVSFNMSIYWTTVE